MACCPSSRRPAPALGPALVVVNGVVGRPVAAVAAALEGFLRTAPILPAGCRGPPLQLQPDRPALLHGLAALDTRHSTVVRVHDPFESFALVLRTAPGVRRLPPPAVRAVLVYTPFATLVAAAVEALKAGTALHVAVQPVLDFPLLFRASPTAQPGHLEYLRPADLRRAARLLAKAAVAEDSAVMRDVEAYLRDGLDLCCAARGGYIVPRSPLYDAVVLSTCTPQQVVAQLSTALAAAQRTQRPPVLAADWESQKGVATLCQGCFRAVASLDLALLADPRARARAGLPLCGPCLRLQAALLLRGTVPLEVGCLLPRFSGALVQEHPSLGGSVAEAVDSSSKHPPAITDMDLLRLLVTCAFQAYTAPPTATELSNVAPCVAQALCSGEVSGPFAYEAATAQCAAQQEARRFAQQVLQSLGIPFQTVGCMAASAATHGWYTPIPVELTTPSGHNYLWDISGTVWGFFANLSTGFLILGDQLWYDAFLPGAVLVAGWLSTALDAGLTPAQLQGFVAAAAARATPAVSRLAQELATTAVMDRLAFTGLFSPPPSPAPTPSAPALTREFSASASLHRDALVVLQAQPEDNTTPSLTPLHVTEDMTVTARVGPEGVAVSCVSAVTDFDGTTVAGSC